MSASCSPPAVCKRRVTLLSQRGSAKPIAACVEADHAFESTRFVLEGCRKRKGAVHLVQQCADAPDI